jgi:hypothetical protein
VRQLVRTPQAEGDPGGLLVAPTDRREGRVDARQGERIRLQLEILGDDESRGGRREQDKDEQGAKVRQARRV